ncbi:hypothetical protein [Marinovum algicola]|uniref:hypothetical protein n=1 Tax=Marinovum algicola TaxID=42444 RepID=UPI003B52B060
MSSLPNTRGAVARNRFPILFVVGVCLALVLEPAWRRVQDTRVYRDWTYQTPFRDVEILHFSATALEIRVKGTMRKVRPCTTVGAPIVNIVSDGMIRYAEFRSLEEQHTPQSRAAGVEPQPFGPWVIRSPIAWPERARMYRTHNCAGRIQTNLVFDIPWPRGIAASDAQAETEQ